MTEARPSRLNDPAAVRREYASEERFLARRLAARAELHGPLVEDATVAAVAEGAPAHVLEVGCGTGDFSERVQRDAGVDLIALDLSPRMAELTHRRGLIALTADIPALPFAAAVFECVLANRVLYHVLELGKGVAEIARVLRPGGRLVAVTYSDDHLGEMFDVVGRSTEPSTFSAESGATLLGEHFERVERRDFSGTARFATVDAIRAGLDAYGEFGWFSDIDLDARLADVRVPFEATYRHCVFVAQKSH